MIVTRPDYFDEFRCIADKCKDTCCAGWQITIDEVSLEKYRKTKGDYIWKIMTNIDWEESCFRQDSRKRCSFLNEDNLCEMYQNLGEDSLCKTCRDYPRHTEEFEGVREVTLSASCPEVARIIMERKTSVTFISEERQEEETLEFGDFDPFLYSMIQDARNAMIEILQNRKLSINERMILVLGMAHDIQRRVNGREVFSCYPVIEKYQTPKSLDFVREYIKQKSKVKHLIENLGNIQISSEEYLARSMFPIIYELEVLREDWKELLIESEKILFFSKEWDYTALKREYESWKQENASLEIEIKIEQIMVYFLFTYFPASVYDGQIYAKAQMALYCTWMIELLWMAHWYQNGKNLKQDEMIEIFYRFSRETEHSDENLEILDDIMIQKWFL